jgi:hypothetical protein
MARWKLKPPLRFHSGAWRSRDPYTGTKPALELRPPYKWHPEKK